MKSFHNKSYYEVQVLLTLQQILKRHKKPHKQLPIPTQTEPKQVQKYLHVLPPETFWLSDPEESKIPMRLGRNAGI